MQRYLTAVVLLLSACGDDEAAERRSACRTIEDVFPRVLDVGDDARLLDAYRDELARIGAIEDDASRVAAAAALRDGIGGQVPAALSERCMTQVRLAETLLMAVDYPAEVPPCPLQANFEAPDDAPWTAEADWFSNELAATRAGLTRARDEALARCR
jgi:hypothetical protein